SLGENRLDVADTVPLRSCCEIVNEVAIDVHGVHFSFVASSGGQAKGKVTTPRADLGNAGLRRDLQRRDDVRWPLPAVATEARVRGALQACAPARQPTAVWRRTMHRDGLIGKRHHYESSCP